MNFCLLLPYRLGNNKYRFIKKTRSMLAKLGFSDAVHVLRRLKPPLRVMLVSGAAHTSLQFERFDGRSAYVTFNEMAV